MNQSSFKVNDVQEEKKPVTVFWDIENCAVPIGVRGYEVVTHIRKLALEHGFLSKTVAIGNLTAIPQQLRNELQGSAVSMQDVSSGKPSAADIAILVEILKFVCDNVPPHVLILISGDRDFSNVLSVLVGRGYEVILIHPQQVSDILRYAATKALSWPSLLGVEKNISNVPTNNPVTPSTKTQQSTWPRAVNANSKPPLTTEKEEVKSVVKVTNQIADLNNNNVVENTAKAEIDKKMRKKTFLEVAKAKATQPPTATTSSPKSFKQPISPSSNALKDSKSTSNKPLHDQTIVTTNMIVTSTVKSPPTTSFTQTSIKHRFDPLRRELYAYKSRGIYEVSLSSLGDRIPYKTFGYKKFLEYINDAIAFWKGLIILNGPPYSVQLRVTQQNGNAQVRSPKIDGIVSSIPLVYQSLQKEFICPLESTIKMRLKEILGHNIDAEMWNTALNELTMANGWSLKGTMPVRTIVSPEGLYECANPAAPMEDRLPADQWTQFEEYLKTNKEWDWVPNQGRFNFSVGLKKHGPAFIRDLPLGIVIEQVQLAINKQLLFREKNVIIPLSKYTKCLSADLNPFFNKLAGVVTSLSSSKNPVALVSEVGNFLSRDYWAQFGFSKLKEGLLKAQEHGIVVTVWHTKRPTIAIVANLMPAIEALKSFYTSNGTQALVPESALFTQMRQLHKFSIDIPTWKSMLQLMCNLPVVYNELQNGMIYLMYCQPLNTYHNKSTAPKVLPIEKPQDKENLPLLQENTDKASKPILQSVKSDTTRERSTKPKPISQKNGSPKKGEASHLQANSEDLKTKEKKKKIRKTKKKRVDDQKKKSDAVEHKSDDKKEENNERREERKELTKRDEKKDINKDKKDEKKDDKKRDERKDDKKKDEKKDERKETKDTINKKKDEKKDERKETKDTINKKKEERKDDKKREERKDDKKKEEKKDERKETKDTINKKDEKKKDEKKDDKKREERKEDKKKEEKKDERKETKDKKETTKDKRDDKEKKESNTKEKYREKRDDKEKEIAKDDEKEDANKEASTTSATTTTATTSTTTAKEEKDHKRKKKRSQSTNTEHEIATTSDAKEIKQMKEERIDDEKEEVEKKRKKKHKHADEKEEKEDTHLDSNNSNNNNNNSNSSSNATATEEKERKRKKERKEAKKEKIKKEEKEKEKDEKEEETKDKEVKEKKFTSKLQPLSPKKKNKKRDERDDDSKDKKKPILDQDSCTGYSSSSTTTSNSTSTSSNNNEQEDLSKKEIKKIEASLSPKKKNRKKADTTAENDDFSKEKDRDEKKKKKVKKKSSGDWKHLNDNTSISAVIEKEIEKEKEKEKADNSTAVKKKKKKVKKNNT